MSDPSRDVRTLLDRAAAGPIGPAPIAELVGQGARRRRTWQVSGVGLTAAVTAVVIVVVLGIVGQSRRTGAPTVPGTSSTAAEIAHGTWHNIPAPPIRVCGQQLVTSIGSRVLLVVSQDSTRCPGAAASYDPRSNRWTKLPPPPAALRGLLTSTGNLFVSTVTGAIVVVDLRSGRWRSEPSLPVVPGPLAVVVAGAARPFVIGAGAQHDRVYLYAEKRWIAEPTLPHPGANIVAVAAYSGGGATWAFLSEERTTRDGFSGGLTVLRLGANGWTVQPRLPNRPLTVRQVDALGADHQLVIGDNCLPNAKCPPVGGPEVEVADLDRGKLRLLPDPPSLREGVTAAVNAGPAVIELDLEASVGSDGVHPPVNPISTAVYDLQTNRWFAGPHTFAIDNIAGTAWTPEGLVVVGVPTEKCSCHPGGLILRPARG